MSPSDRAQPNRAQSGRRNRGRGPQGPGRSGTRGATKPADPARLAAFEVLKAVRVDEAYANLVLPHVLGRLGLEGRDAAFATELASGTLRQQGTYDAILAACIDRPLAKVEAKVLDVLRLGAHQILSMRVPDHAAISTSVDLARSKVGQGPAGFVNAVLRKVSRSSLEEWVIAVAPAREKDHDGWAAVAFSHPRWVVERLAEAVGRDQVDALLAADNVPPAVTLVARPGRSSLEELGGAPTAHSPYGATLESGSPAGIPAVAEGRAGVQDEGSQLVALALAEAGLESRGPEVWLDACAGPGGKSALLAALASQRGASLVANERQPHRAGLVRQNLLARESDALVPGAAGVVAGDGTRAPFRAGVFDRVLVDAPCTGLGALRRRPESRWRRTARDLDVLIDLQRSLLERAIDLTRPGGAVLYATCSPVLAETQGVVEHVLSARSDLRVEPIAATVGQVPNSAGPIAGTVQLWPHRHGTDAMFLALLRRDEA
ncbi:16S rRNA (cytosine967-C5)-methyltransferase [Nocardioides albertanoniae]|uniref:16S rRNA (Cytosine967-C5)-methyltransferase n=1 Tax=Nocardioides albertanoniae TaxID=1175486 RepID=A0A543A6V2_9ACTN|nr:transcription antitermination factor NusB [Nocardioides albertanoniae]TQL68342.1 16S rRNA (cytosine967-C5)-methyltransferase [Nocardioides albertanoniae]